MNALLMALAEAIDSRDPYTAGHSERVAQLVVAYAYSLSSDPKFKDIQFTDAELREIYYAGILHDVGKIGIKEDVLTKNTRLPARRMDIIKARFLLHAQTTPGFDAVKAYECIQNVNRTMTPSYAELAAVQELGKQSWLIGDESLPLLYEDELEVLLLEYGNLTPDERKEIMRHPAESERILQHIPLKDGYANMLSIIRQHHERMDGSGYPDGLRRDEILLQSRLMAVVDIYDAVTQERHYKPAYTRSEAMKILKCEVDGGKLDPILTDFFFRNIEQIEALSERVKTTRVTHLSEIGNFATL
jgi:HD-GYP domain-containing protein (c-di-GMP phosphodiesterase class II)